VREGETQVIGLPDRPSGPLAHVKVVESSMKYFLIGYCCSCLSRAIRSCQSCKKDDAEGGKKIPNHTDGHFFPPKAFSYFTLLTLWPLIVILYPPLNLLIVMAKVA